MKTSPACKVNENNIAPKETGLIKNDKLLEEFNEIRGMVSTVKGLSKIMVEVHQSCDLAESDFLCLIYVIKDMTSQIQERLGNLELLFE